MPAYVFICVAIAFVAAVAFPAAAISYGMLLNRQMAQVVDRQGNGRGRSEAAD